MPKKKQYSGPPHHKNDCVARCSGLREPHTAFGDGFNIVLGAAIRSGGLTRARFLQKNAMSSSSKMGRFLEAGTSGGLEVIR